MLAALELCHASFQIEDKLLLRDIHVTFAPATLYALLGANGSGKSTLLRALAGRFALTEGHIVCGQELLSSMSRQHVARALSFMPQVFMQTSTLSLELTVLDWVMMGCYAREKISTISSRQRCKQALDAVGMAGFATQQLHTLSQGQKQKIALARLISTQTAIYLLDEPTAHLDIRQKQWVWAFLQSIARSGTLVIVATHDVDMACAYAHEALCIRQGQLIAQGPCASVLTEAQIDRLYQD